MKKRSVQARKDNIMLARCIACIMVFVCHLCQKLYLSSETMKITQFGRFGVQIFFIISGFLIADSYYSYGKDNIKLYVKKKVIRILPLYYGIVLYYFLTDYCILKYRVPDITGYGWIRYLLPPLNAILPYNYDRPDYWWNLGMSWTIPIFIGSYIIFPIVLGQIEKLKKYMCGVSRYIMALIVFIFTLIINSACIRARYFPNSFLIAEYLKFFSMGIVLYYAEQEEKINHLCVLSCAYLVYVLVTQGDEALSYGLIFLTIIALTMNISIKSGTSQRILKIIDKYSFTIYLTQSIPLTQFIREYESRNGIIMPRHMILILTLLTTIIFTLIFYYLLQRPFEKLGRRLQKNSV